MVNKMAHPLIDLIEYDPAVLLSMTQKELGVQLIARMDLRQPNRKEKLDAHHAFEAMHTRAVQYLAEVEALGISVLSEDLKEIVERYFAPVEVVV